MPVSSGLRPDDTLMEIAELIAEVVQDVYPAKPA